MSYDFSLEVDTGGPYGGARMKLVRAEERAPYRPGGVAMAAPDQHPQAPSEQGGASSSAPSSLAHPHAQDESGGSLSNGGAGGSTSPADPGALFGPPRLTMLDGTEYRVEPIGNVDSALFGSCLEAGYEREPGWWDEGLFRRDLIASIQPGLG